MAAYEGCFVSVISDRASDLPNEEEIDGIHVIRIDHLTPLPLINKLTLEKLSLKNSPDAIIWCGSPLSALYLNQLKTPRPIIWDIDIDLSNLKTLTQISLRELINPKHKLLTTLILAILLPRFFFRSIANSSLIAKIIVPSQHIKKTLIKIGVLSNKIEIIPSTIEKVAEANTNRNKKKNESRDSLGIAQQNLIVTYFGSPCTLRGTDTAIYGMKKVAVYNKNVQLFILSRRPLDTFVDKNDHLKKEETSLFELRTKLHLENNVTIISGIMNKDVLREYVNASDLIVLPFKFVFSEPPLAILESMALGKTVLTTNLGTLAEIVDGERGILIKPGDSESFAHSILHVVTHPEKLALLGKRAQEYAFLLPDWDAVALRFQEIVTQTVK
jgi:glycosyltransferase involved in cell wall biosynthesis